MSDQQKQLEQARKERGAQLRALVVSWDENKTFVEALGEQQQQIDAGTFAPADDWSVMADEILGAYMSRPRMSNWDEKPEEPEGPKLVIP